MERLGRKFDTARTLVPQPVVDIDPEAEVGIIAYGSSHWSVEEARDQLRDEAGVRTSYLRLRGYPFSPKVDEFIRRYERIYVVEQNRDGQMKSLLRMDGQPGTIARLRSVLHFDGLPIDARSITEGILKQEREGAAAPV